MKREPRSVSDLSEGMQPFLDELQKESDRGAALVASAFFEETIGAMLKGYFIDDEKAVGEMLGNARFSTRVNMAYCLGLLGPDMYEDLKLIAQIRNKFAHRLFESPSFEHPEIAELCGKIKQTTFVHEHLIRTNRDRFVVAVATLANILLIRCCKLKHQPKGSDYRFGELDESVL